MSKARGRRMRLMTGRGSMRLLRAPHPKISMAAAGTSDLTSRVALRRLKMLPRFFCGAELAGIKGDGVWVEREPAALCDADDERSGEGGRHDKGDGGDGGHQHAPDSDAPGSFIGKVTDRGGVETLEVDLRPAGDELPGHGSEYQDAGHHGHGAEQFTAANTITLVAGFLLA